MDYTAPLRGVRVLELGHVVAAPFAGMIMADLGAEVIKVERPGGEVARNLPDQGPSIFYALNRGKKSVTLNLKDPRGREAYLRLARVSDVILENMGPGVAERLGVGFEDVSKVNPRIIYVSIKGFGRGVLEDRPALDVVAQALSGIMTVTGQPGGEPVRVGTSIADMLAGIFAVLQALIALRDESKRPTYIEAPLYDSLLPLMAYWVAYVQIRGRDPKPIGSGHTVWSPYRAFRVRDGWVFIGITSNKHWKAFCESLGFHDLLEDPRFQDNNGRASHKELLESVIEERLRGFTRDEVVNILSKAGVPVAPIRRVSELLEDDYLLSRGILRQGKGLEGEELLYVTTPLFMTGYKVVDPGRPPLPGEHNREILEGLLGYTREEVEELEREGVI